MLRVLLDAGRVVVLDEGAVRDLNPQQVDVACPLALGLVHQLVGALDEIRREAARDEAALGHAPEPQADDPDVDARRLHGQAAVLERPVEALDRRAEPLADRVRLVIVGEIRNEETELVAAKPRVEILGPRAAGPFLGDEIVRARLLAQNLGDALDDAIADCMSERVVVPLEPGDVDEADGAPLAALLEREQRLELLGEAPEVHQLRLRIAVRLVGEIGDESLEVARDAVDGGVFGRQFGLHARHLVGESGGQRLDGFVLRLLPQALVAGEYRVDGVEQRAFEMSGQMERVAHPLLQFVARLWLRAGHRFALRPHGANGRDTLSHFGHALPPLQRPYLLLIKDFRREFLSQRLAHAWARPVYYHFCVKAPAGAKGRGGVGAGPNAVGEYRISA